MWFSFGPEVKICLPRQSSQSQERARSEAVDDKYEKTLTEKSEREGLLREIRFNNTFTGLSANSVQLPRSEQTSLGAGGLR